MEGFIVLLIFYAVIKLATKKKESGTAQGKAQHNQKVTTMQGMKAVRPESASDEHLSDERDVFGHTMAQHDEESHCVMPGEHGFADKRDVFAGSLHAETTEGEDIGHEHSSHLTSRPAEQEAPALGNLGVAFSRDDLVRAVVMQEILTRPCDRRRNR
ncbi:MAG: hypothetical protein Q4C54_01600 [Clostridia bacterium]|nr:hypothetical protein [Clostridia bacterium]